MNGESRIRVMRYFYFVLFCIFIPFHSLHPSLFSMVCMARLSVIAYIYVHGFHFTEMGLICIMNTRCLHAYWNIRRQIQDNIDTKYHQILFVGIWIWNHILDLMNANIPCGVFKYSGQNQWRVQKRSTDTKLSKTLVESIFSHENHYENVHSHT